LADSNYNLNAISARLKSVRPAWVLAGAIIVGFIIGIIGDNITVCHVSTQPTGCAPATYLLAQNNELIIQAHTYWQLFTSIFVTDSFFDAGFNALAVLILDRILDDAFNFPRFFTIFFITALLGNIFSLYGNSQIYVSAGASGGIFGLFAAMFSYSWASQKKIDTAGLLFFLALFFTSSFLFSNVDYFAHLGGSIGGFICGPLLYELLKNKVSRYESVKTSSSLGKLLSTLLVMALLLGSVIQFLVFVTT